MEAKELADMIRQVIRRPGSRGGYISVGEMEDLVNKLDPPRCEHMWEDGTFASLNWEIRLRHCETCGRIEFFENATIGWKKWYEGVNDRCRNSPDKK